MKIIQNGHIHQSVPDDDPRPPLDPAYVKLGCLDAYKILRRIAPSRKRRYPRTGCDPQAMKLAHDLMRERAKRQREEFRVIVETPLVPERPTGCLFLPDRFIPEEQGAVFELTAGDRDWSNHEAIEL